MKNTIAILILIFSFSITVYSQIQQLTLIDSILNNQVNVSAIKGRNIIASHISNPKKGSSMNSGLSITCDSDSEMIARIGDSLYIYNFDFNTTTFVTKAIQGIFGSFGYLGGDEPKIITIADLDSVYYFTDTSLVYSGFIGNSGSDLIHTGCGNKSTYFMGGHLWHFNGSSNPKLIRSNIHYSVADLAVDERGNAWVLTGTNWPISDTLRIIDSTGTSLCDIPFTKPVSTLNGYGMLIRNGKAIVGFGPGNSTYPNSLVPLEVSLTGDSVSFGQPILQSTEFTYDLAGCAKDIFMPVCNVTSLENLLKTEIVNIWPNPFINRLFLDSDNQEITRIKIFDSLGTIYADVRNNSSYFELDVSSYPKGFYMITVEINSNKLCSKKLIKS